MLVCIILSFLTMVAASVICLCIIYVSDIFAVATEGK